MPVINVQVVAEADGKIELFDKSRISISAYAELIGRQYGAESITWKNESNFIFSMMVPFAFDVSPGGILNETDTRVAINYSMLQEMADDPDWLHIVCMIMRPGTYLFMRKLEIEHYRPTTPRNNLFHFTTCKWQDMNWAIVTVPIKERNIVEQVAKECGMQLADGIPHVISSAVIEKFPMSSERVFSLRNSENSFVYNGMAAADMTHEIEMKAVQEIERHHSYWLKSQGS